eukprot:COSAG02_NODE_2108_length_9809_cov_4.022966_3_plen_41_part_00
MQIVVEMILDLVTTKYKIVQPTQLLVCKAVDYSCTIQIHS